MRFVKRVSAIVMLVLTLGGLLLPALQALF